MYVTIVVTAVSAYACALATSVASGFEGRILGFDKGMADRWGRLMGEGIANGRVPPVTDSMIAATALSREMTVVTRNVRDFKFEGLQVVNPFGD